MQTQVKLYEYLTQFVEKENWGDKKHGDSSTCQLLSPQKSLLCMCDFAFQKL